MEKLLMVGIPCLVSVISIFISHKLGSKDFSKKRHLEICRERYDNFYIPYLKIMYGGNWLSGKFDRYGHFLDHGSDIYLLLLDNLVYLDPKTSVLIPEFLNHHSNASKFSYGLKDLPDEIANEYTNFIDRLTIIVVEEAEYLCKELGLKDISTPFAAFYFEYDHKHNTE